MFFNRTARTGHENVVEGPTTATVPAQPAADTVSTLIDAIGQLLGLYQQGVFDMPDRPADQARAELDRWRRHAVIGTRSPDDDGESVTAAAHQRDWGGIARQFGEHRRAEKRYVERAFTDLRDALWMCVDHTYQSLRNEQLATEASASEVDRVRDALEQLETGVIKDEITHAMRRLDAIASEQRSAQQAVYGQLAQRIEQLGTQLEEARKTSETDALTGLGNRLAFDRAMARQLHLHALSGNPLTVISIDLDHLKRINDDLGHAVGDEALVASGKAFHSVFMRENDVICRLGGDEFAVILTNTTHELGERLLQRLESAMRDVAWGHADAGYPLQVSAGAAQWQRGETVVTWFARADAAMYAHKRQKQTAISVA